jgi:hypothetical protein
MDNFGNYDAWRTRAPEDEQGYWEGREREIDEDEERADQGLDEDE